MIVDRTVPFKRNFGISRNRFGAPLRFRAFSGRFGRQIEAGRGVFANVVKIRLAGEPNVFETHRNHLGLQPILSDEERIRRISGQAYGRRAVFRGKEYRVISAATPQPSAQRNFPVFRPTRTRPAGRQGLRTSEKRCSGNV